MATRQEQREKRRQEILEIALDLFISKGYANTKISDIADKAGMSAGLMFHYFKSKAKLYEELIRIGVSGPVPMMEPDCGDPLRFFETAAASILSMLRGDPFVAKMYVLMTRVRFDPSLPEPVLELVKDVSALEKTVSLIKKGQSLGQLRPGDPQALAVLFWQSLSGVAFYAALFPEAPLPEPEWIIDSIRKKS